MPAFTINVYTETTDYVRRNAEKLGCKLSMDSKKMKKVLVMNEKGGIDKNGKPYLACLCKVGKIETIDGIKKVEKVHCPCDEAPEELKNMGHCYCGIFES